MFDEMDNALEVDSIEAQFASHFFRFITSLAKASDLPHQVSIRRRTTCDVFNQAHEELIFAAGINYYRGNRRGAKCEVCFDSTLAAYKVITSSVNVALTTRHRY